MDIFKKVLSRPELDERPPVLVDVGSSSGVHQAWKVLARYSICLAFDPDEREMGVVQRQSREYRELYVFPCAVGPEPPSFTDLYLTKSPACPSLLKPRPDKLANYEFADRFSVVGKASVTTIDLKTALARAKLDRVDWFKTDSQGMDLRLFTSLGSELLRRVIVAELEPGIIHAYEGEDKLWQVVSYMEANGFWLSRMELKGSQRFNRDLIEGLSFTEKSYLVHLLKAAPGWAEVEYLNSFVSAQLDLRDHLLGWVCAMACGEYGFAAELAINASRRFEDAIFTDL